MSDSLTQRDVFALLADLTDLGKYKYTVGRLPELTWAVSAPPWHTHLRADVPPNSANRVTDLEAWAAFLGSDVEEAPDQIGDVRILAASGIWRGLSITVRAYTPKTSEETTR